MRSVLRLTAAAGLLVGLVAVGRAAQEDKPLTDKEFVMKAASSNQHEIVLGKLAQERAANAEVKKFGQRMVTDHSKALDELKEIAKGMGVEVSEKMMEEHQKHVDRLKDLRGAEFDQAYMKHMVDSHEKGVKMFEKASKECKDARLRQWAEKTLPTIKDHLEQARKINDQLQKQ